MSGYSDLADLNCTCRPIDRWHGPLTPDAKRERSRFKKSWSQIVGDLGRELRHLSARKIIIMLAIGERDIVNSGDRPRADARAEHPGIILSFESPTHGPMRIACDHFRTWMDNIQAIAQGMHDIRRLERYGIIKSSHAYTSWKALPGGSPAESSADNHIMTLDDAVQLIRLFSDVPAGDILGNYEAYKDAMRRALLKTHPDRHPDKADDYAQVEEARRLLDAHHKW